MLHYRQDYSRNLWGDGGRDATPSRGVHWHGSNLYSTVAFTALAVKLRYRETDAALVTAPDGLMGPDAKSPQFFSPVVATILTTTVAPFTWGTLNLFVMIVFAYSRHPRALLLALPPKFECNSGCEAREKPGASRNQWRLSAKTKKCCVGGGAQTKVALSEVRLSSLKRQRLDQ